MPLKVGASLQVSSSIGLNFLSDLYSRKVIRIFTIFSYFVLFQTLILIQKPFLQFDFIVVFYLSFGILFSHHFVGLFLDEKKQSEKFNFISYLADFAVLILFMKYFPYLSSFILVLQLFLLFIASFDLNFFNLILLGFTSSIGVSIINMSSANSGSIQGILSLTLFNLSYVSVIVVSNQLKNEFGILQKDLTVTQKKWKTQEEFSKMVIENIPFGVAVYHQDYQPVLKNSYLVDQIKLNEEDLKTLIRSYDISNKAFDNDYVYKSNKNESKIVNIDKTNYFDSEINEQLSVYLVKDVTQMRELEMQKKQSEKMAAVGQLAAGIAHEIRNPLAGISGSVQLLSQDTQDETQKKLMNIILKEIDRLNLLITEFLDYAKPEKFPDTKVNIKNVIEDVLLICKRHPEIGENFIWNIQLIDMEILGFHEKLKQAFLNIIINGIQAMKDRPQAQYNISLQIDNDYAVLKLQDTGSGMSEDNKRRMFEPFHTTKIKGTGLGLAITHKILENHKAIIIVNSEINVGTEFIIKFPAVKG